MLHYLKILRQRVTLVFLSKFYLSGFTVLKGVSVHRVLYQSILNEKLTGRKTLGRKMCSSNRDDCKLENTFKQSRFKHLGELHKE